MENPNTWNKTKRIIAEAITEHSKNKPYGLSLVTVIYNKLLEEDLLKEENSDGK